MFILVAYDIEDDRRRSRLATEMENFGRRVQRSVFECHLNRRQLADLMGRIERLIEPDKDRVRGYRLCRKDRDRIVVDGVGGVTEDVDYFLF